MKSLFQFLAQISARNLQIRIGLALIDAYKKFMTFLSNKNFNQNLRKH